MSSFFLFIFLFVSSAWAGLVPGAIPLKDIGRPATDIVYQGKVQTPDELAELKKKGVKLNALNPVETSDLWRDRVSVPVDPSFDQIGIDVNQPVTYLANQPARLGVFKFNVKQVDAQGQSHLYTVLASKSSYSYLLRKALLRKLGYFVPPIQRASNLTLKFRADVLKKTFLTDMKSKTMADPSRWVTNLADEASLDMNLQDVLIFSSNESTYNLATGFIPADVIQGRRLLNSLIIPYGIADIPGTINGLSWKAGRVIDDSLFFDFEGVDEFSTPLDDALWMATRLQKLSRQDFIDIVAQTELPGPVQILLVEKLISRTRSVAEALSMKGSKLDFNAKVNVGQEVIEGVLKRTTWPGYGSLFATENPPETPLSDQEITAFFKAKIESSVIDSLMNMFNNKVIKGTDIEKKVIERQVEAAQNQFYKFLETGKVEKVPFGLFAFPTFSANFYISRDIVVGKYLGTDNLIQLADSLEISGKAGVFVSAVGLPENLAPAFQAGVRVSRTYTHLKPTQSVRAASKEPYRNLFVNLLAKKKAGIFDELVSDEFAQLPEDKKQEKLKDVLSEFNKQLQVGESFIIANTLAGVTSLDATLTLDGSIKIQPSFFAQRILLNRVHILKFDENTIHVYKDLGNGSIKGLGISLNIYIPILSISYQKSKGVAQTTFHKLNVNTKDNPDLLNNLLGLRLLLKESSLELIQTHNKPFYVTHDFNSDISNFGFLFWRSASIDTADEIKVYDQEKASSRNFFTASAGKRTGKDYQSFAIDVVNAVLEQEASKDLMISNPGSGDPGDSYKGKSFTRNTTLEIERDRGSTINPFLNIRYNWKGWRANVKEMRKIIGEVNKKFSRELFSDLDLYGTSEFQLYSVDVDMFLYESAVQDLMTVDAGAVKRLLEEKGIFPSSARTPRESIQDWERRERERKNRLIRSVLRNREKALAAYSKNQFKDGTEKALDYLSGLEGYLPFPEFIRLLGSLDGLYVQGRINGFRKENENGDLAIVSDSFGRVGSELIRGGLNQIQRDLGISRSEFMGFWMIREL